MNSDHYVEQAIVQLLSLKVRAGASIAELTDFAQSCVAKARRATSQEAHYVGLDIHKLGSVLRTWHKDANYLTADGLPKPLRVAGRHGLRSLIKKHYPTAAFSDVFKRLLDTRLVSRHGDEKWIPSERTARITQLSHETLEHLAEGVSRYVETVTRNVTAKTDDDVLFERSCKVTSLPEAQFGAFRDYVGQQALAFLSAVDDWLEARNRPSGRRNVQVCTAGVYTFAYVKRRQASNEKQRSSRPRGER
jgi:hypothetical protein